MPSSAPTLRFFGAIGTVTGSRFLLETPRARVLVDCGLFQGLSRSACATGSRSRSSRATRRRGADARPSRPLGISARAGRQGSRAPHSATESTAALCSDPVAPRRAHPRRGRQLRQPPGLLEHLPALPLFSEADSVAALRRLRPVATGAALEVAPGVAVSFHRAGHILGSAWLRIVVDGREDDALIASGDLGRPNHPMLLPPKRRPRAAPC